LKDYNEQYKDLKFSNIRFINDRIARYGNGEILSIKLNRHENYVDDTLKRGTFAKLHRLRKEINDMEGNR
jgi:hypothetical protein